MAATEKEVLPSSHIFLSPTGSVIISGAVFTVSLATVEVTAGAHVPLTFTLKRWPLMAAVVPDTVSSELTASDSTEYVASGTTGFQLSPPSVLISHSNTRSSPVAVTI